MRLPGNIGLSSRIGRSSLLMFLLASALDPIGCALAMGGAAAPSPVWTAHRSSSKITCRANPADRPNLEPVDAEVQRWIDLGAFPGAVLAVGQHGRLVMLKAFGKMSMAPGAPPMPADALFDLASLTKVIGTTSAAAVLYDHGLLKLDVPVATYLPEFGNAPGHADITVRELLVHASGLSPSATPLWRQANERAGILAIINRMAVSPAPGTEYHYLDENMILIEEIVRRISGQPFDIFLHDSVFAPLGMSSTRFNPPASELGRIPPTEQDERLRHTLVHGVVHDENAYVMDGVAGNAGLFSTACDLGRLAQMYLNRGTLDGHRIVSPATIDLFRTRQNIPSGSSRALGWDTKGSAGDYVGPLGSPASISHTGFTGTSAYIDFDRDAFVILLTNRINPTRNNPLINQARPAITTAVLKVLDATPRDDSLLRAAKRAIRSPRRRLGVTSTARINLRGLSS